MFYFLIIFSKLVSFFSRLFKIGAGSTWPGHLVLSFDSKFIRKILQKNPHLKIVIITGTNGKTTTVALLKHFLEKNNISCFSNQEGANLLNGIASSLIKNTNFFGKINKEVALFEVDEFNFPLVLTEVSPLAIIILNLFRDQLDRYGEVNTIFSRWLSALKNVSPAVKVFLNGDDPQLYYLGQKISGHVFYFGIEQEVMPLKKVPHDVDFNYCPICFQLLRYKRIAYSHLGKFFCQNCGFRQTDIFTLKEDLDNFSLKGIYNRYNLTAVFLFLEKIFCFQIEKLKLQIEDFLPAFGRQEKINYKKRDFYLLLSKNPAGFNQSIEAAISFIKNKKHIFWLILNNRVPDGHDVSWIWDVDFKKIFLGAKKIFISGDRAFDMAIRLKYEKSGLKKIIIVEEDFKKALKKITTQTFENEKIFILPNYSAMLEIRKILVGKKFL